MKSENDFEHTLEYWETCYAQYLSARQEHDKQPSVALLQYPHTISGVAFFALKPNKAFIFCPPPVLDDLSE
jgi:hypothetical protein